MFLKKKQLRINYLDSLNADLKRQIDSNHNSLESFEDKISQLKQTIQILNEKFNERNKIEVYLSKNGK